MLFHPLTAKYMYEWHFAVHFDTASDHAALIGLEVDYIQKLIDMHRLNFAEVQRKRQLIRELAYSLQYSLVYLNNNTNTVQVSRRNTSSNTGMSKLLSTGISSSGSSVSGGDNTAYSLLKSIGHLDAYDLTMAHLLAIHSGRLTHNRTTDYLLCAQIPGGGQTKLQTSDHCSSMNTSVDPFYPPSVLSPLYKLKK